MKGDKSVTPDCFIIDPEYRAFLLTEQPVGSVCELGCKGFGKTKTAFESLGWRHTSIDLNGLGGALPIDLTKPIDVRGIGGPFDVVTNFGTSEHVEGQYECWKNIFSLCRVGGHIVCCVPWIWPKHGKYYPSIEWYLQLGERNDMKVISAHPVQGGRLNVAVFKKLANASFRMPEDSLMKVQESTKVGAYI
jgi:hypothetical protein